MSITLLFVILKWVGVALEVLKYLQAIWEYIKLIRDKDERKVRTAQLRGIMWDSVKRTQRRGKTAKMSTEENSDLDAKARVLFHQVQAILNEEGKL